MSANNSSNTYQHTLKQIWRVEEQRVSESQIRCNVFHETECGAAVLVCKKYI